MAYGWYSYNTSIATLPNAYLSLVGVGSTTTRANIDLIDSRCRPFTSQPQQSVTSVGCSTGLRVDAAEINSQCANDWETARSRVFDVFGTNYYVFDVAIGSDYGIERDYPSFDDPFAYTGGERRAKANIRATLPGYLYWTYYVRCTRDGQTHQQLVQGQQHVKCP